jgi:hypothetical protein
VALGGSGEYLDVTMTDAVASFSTAYADGYFGDGTVPTREGTRLLGRHPGYRVYEAGDGVIANLERDSAVLLVSDGRTTHGRTLGEAAEVAVESDAAGGRSAIVRAG